MEGLLTLPRVSQQLLLNRVGGGMSPHRAVMTVKPPDGLPVSVVDVGGLFIGVQAALPIMVRTVAGKGAIRLLTKAVANEVATRGIRVNSVHPGPTATKLGARHEIARDQSGTLFPSSRSSPAGTPASR